MIIIIIQELFSCRILSSRFERSINVDADEV